MRIGLTVFDNDYFTFFERVFNEVTINVNLSKRETELEIYKIILLFVLEEDAKRFGMSDQRKSQALSLHYIFKNLEILYGESEIQAHFKEYTDETLDLNSELIIGCFNEEGDYIDYQSH